MARRRPHRRCWEKIAHSAGRDERLAIYEMFLGSWGKKQRIRIPVRLGQRHQPTNSGELGKLAQHDDQKPAEAPSPSQTKAGVAPDAPANHGASCTCQQESEADK